MAGEQITQTITAAPAAPDRQSPSTFSDRADTFLAWLVTFVTQLITLITQINSVSTAVNSDKLAAEAARVAAEDASNAEVYSGVAIYNSPKCTVGSDGITYRCMNTNVSGDNPVGSVTGSWKALNIEKYPVRNLGSYATGTIVVNLANGQCQKVTITGNVTINFSGFINAYHSSVMLIITDSGGPHTITWSNAVDWMSGAKPMLVGNSRNRFMFASEDGGTIIDGAHVGGGFA